jgi:hypothetical protein
MEFLESRSVSKSIPKQTPFQRTHRVVTDPLKCRSEYEVGQASLRRLIGAEDAIDANQGPFAPIPAGVVGAAVEIAASVLENLKQANSYLRDEGLRTSVMRTVLNSLPLEGELVIIGHSLGSLVAIDLLDHLPEGLTVRRLITIGSPAGLPLLHAHSERLLKAFPFGIVGSWLNALSPWDHVTSGRGLTNLFPAAHDLRVQLPPLEHSAPQYLAHRQLILAIGEALFGSMATDIAQAENSIEIGPTPAESQVLFALSFAHMTLDELRDQDTTRAAKYEQALASVQRAVTERLSLIADQEGRQLSAAIRALSTGEAPECPNIWAVDVAIRMIVVAATTNLVAPWDIDSRAAGRRALVSAAVHSGLGAQQGTKINEAITAARSGIGLDRGVHWNRILIGAAGIALLASGPLGLILAAPARLAGAAAMTSALVAFGPGGMVGGMALAGTLVGTGAVTATSALIARDSQLVLETEVLRRMAHSLARKRLGLVEDPSDWLMLTGMESEVSAELDKLEAFSDSGTPTLKALKAKAGLLRRAIKWMLHHDLGPHVLAT